MEPAAFRTGDGTAVPAVTADEMRAVDRVAVEELGLSLLQLMEHAGRTLTRHVLDRDPDGRVVVLAGAGGNGGGGLACARHLRNRALPVTVVLDRPPSKLEGAPAAQFRVLDEMGVPFVHGERLPAASVVVDALVGYGLRGAPRGTIADLLLWAGETTADVVSLDVPTGVDATTGEVPGASVRPSRTVTLALPKTGLRDVPGDLYLGDIGLPATVYERLDIPYRPPFGNRFAVELRPDASGV